MNLIEQLGGYECAAYEYKNTLLADDFPYVIKATGTKFTRPELGDELLEHRRQHNIFEVGDLIMYENKLYEIKYIYHPEKARITDGLQGRTVYDFPRGIRHATDAEIKAGKRLEVNS
ncbi:hypothetical protein [Acinetobacter indicus]|uniref:hypothetical protein n=1 Tax=Acinetobacter indicus TaxID=756892 RepID=UPI000CECB634|nr:hypothetical protein [Acinetobacter indicus]